MFNAIEYFKHISEHHILLKDKYKFCRVSGIGYLEEVLQSSKKHSFFLAVDDTNTGYTFKGGGNGYFERRKYYVYILIKLKSFDFGEKQLKLESAREIQRKIESKLLYDKYHSNNGLDYLQENNIGFDEMPGMFSMFTTGIMMSITVDVPITLIYDANEYE